MTPREGAVAVRPGRSVPAKIESAIDTGQRPDPLWRLLMAFRMRFLRLVVAAGIGVTAAASAQVVSSVAGGTITLGSGSSKGIKAGMTGKLCTTETVGGQAVQTCPVAFEVVSVTERSATLRVTKGNAAEVLPGFQAVFARAPSAPKATPAEPAPREPATDDPTALLEAGTRALAVRDYVRAERYLGQLLRLMPDDPLARKRYEEAQAGSAAQEASRVAAEAARRERAEEQSRRQAASKEIAYLRSAMAAASASGDRDAERTYARRLLDLEPSNAKAAAVRDRDRAVAEKARAALADAGDPIGSEEAWRKYEVQWGMAAARAVALAPPLATATPAPSARQGRPAQLASSDWVGKGPVYTVQFTSYRDRKTAERDAAAIGRKVAVPVYAVGIDMGPKGVWYRVMGGGFHSFDEAQAFRDDVIAKGSLERVGFVYRLEGTKTAAAPMGSP